MKYYVFTVKYKQVFDAMWQYKNHIIEDSNVKSAILKVKKLYADTTTVIIDNIYSEDSLQTTNN